MFSTICILIAYLIVIHISHRLWRQDKLKYQDNPVIYFGDREFYYLPNNTYSYNLLDVNNYPLKINTNRNQTNYNYM